MSESDFREATKEDFKEIYFRLGGGQATGYTAKHWQTSFEDDVKEGWRFMIQEPESPEHDRMMIVTDFAVKEYRLFFMTEESLENFFEFPD